MDLVLGFNPDLLSKLDQQGKSVTLICDDANVSTAFSCIKSQTWFDQGILMHDIVADSSAIAYHIQKHLSDACPAIPPYVFSWPLYEDSGRTTARIQNLLIFIKNFQSLLKKYNPTSVWITPTFIENSPLTPTQFKKFTRSFPSTEFIFPKNSPTFKNKFSTKTLLLFKRIRYLAFIFFCLLFKKAPQKQKPSVVITLGNGKLKHFEAALSSVSSFIKDPHYEVRFLLWNMTKAPHMKELSSIGLDFVETYLPFSKLWKTLLTYQKAKTKCSALSFEYTYEGIDLNFFTQELIQEFMGLDFFKQLFLTEALDAYFKAIQPRFIRTFGITIPFGRIVTDLVLTHPNRYGNPALFAYSFGVNLGIEWPVYPTDRYVGTIFVNGLYEQQAFQTRYPSCKVVIAGFPKLTELYQWTQPATTEPNTPFHICFISSNVVEGLYSPMEQYTLLNAMISLARSLGPSMIMTIKLHPSENPDVLTKLLKEHPILPNLKVATTENPYALLSSADLVISKHSTLIFEAALMGKLVVGMALMHQELLKKIFGEAFSVFTQDDALIAYIKACIQDPAYFATQKHLFLTHIQGPLSERFCSPQQSFGTLIYDHLTCKVE